MLEGIVARLAALVDAVPVEVEDRTAGYVILSVTSLPQVDGDAEHPYGLRLTEIGVR